MSVSGGYYAPGYLAPWVTSIRQNRCTASLVAPQRVLTAAHCLKDLTPTDLEVRVGLRDRSNPAEGQTRAVTGIAVHPEFFSPTEGLHQHHNFYDVAVMFLDRPATITPATLGTENDFAATGSALGWGHYNYHAPGGNYLYDPRLKGVNLSLGSDTECDSWINSPGSQHYIPDIHVCAYDPEGDDCTTHGDSGGPLIVDSGGWKLIGVLSYYPAQSSRGPCTNLYISGFTWVAGPALRSWVLTVANPACGPGGEGLRALRLRAAKRQLQKWKRKLRRADGYRAKNRARRNVRKAKKEVRAIKSSNAHVCEA